MIDCLYPCFKHWAEHGSVYIMSDPHFEDSDCKLMDKDWISPEEQIAILKSLVHKSDTLIILGDVGNPEYFAQIKAHKVLIKGNHDAGSINYLHNVVIKNFDIEKYSFEEVSEYMHKHYPKCKIDIGVGYHLSCAPFEFYMARADNCLFDEVYEGALCISEKIILSHEPINLPFMVNIHGHCHDGSRANDYSINVAANVIGYKPLSLGKLIKDGLVSKVPSIHRICIDNATEKAKRRKRK